MFIGAVFPCGWQKSPALSFSQIQTLLKGVTEPAVVKPAAREMTAPVKGPDRRPAMLALHDGLNRCMAGDFPAAIEIFQQANILYRQAGDRRSASLTQNVIILCLNQINDPGQTRRAYEKSIRLLQIAELSDEVARVLLMQARFEHRLGERREAINALRRALVLFREIGHAVGLAEAYCQYAEYELERGRRSEAHAHGRAAREYLERIDDVNTFDKLRVRVDQLMAA